MSLDSSRKEEKGADPSPHCVLRGVFEGFSLSSGVSLPLLCPVAGKKCPLVKAMVKVGLNKHRGGIKRKNCFLFAGIVPPRNPNKPGFSGPHQTTGWHSCSGKLEGAMPSPPSTAKRPPKAQAFRKHHAYVQGREAEFIKQ